MWHYSTNIKTLWSHPGQQTARQDILGRVLVSVCLVSALAAVPAHGKSLGDNLATRRADLRGSTGRYFNHLNTSFCGFVLEDYQELAPASILNRSGNPMVPSHTCDIQAFHRDCSVAGDKSYCDFMMLIPTNIANPGVQFRHSLALPPAGIRSLAFSAQASLFTAKCWQGGFKRFQWWFGIPITSCQEVLQADIYPSSRESAVYLGVRQFANYSRIPFSRFSFYCNCFLFPLDGAMHVDPHETNMLKTQFVPDNTCSIANGRVGNAIESFQCLESRIASLQSNFETLEESRECPVKTLDGGLSGREIKSCKPWIGFALFLKPTGLDVIPNKAFFAFPRILALFQARVVKATMRFQTYFQLPSLIDVRLQAEFVYAEHPSQAIINKSQSATAAKRLYV